MTARHFDIAIAGGGMVGASLALSIAAKLPQLRVVVVEAVELPESGSANSAFSPSFDERSTALSYASELLYAELGAWDVINDRAQPIGSVHVSEQGRFGSTLLQASDYGWPSLGHVVENAWLGKALLGRLQDTAVELRAPERITGANCGAESVELQLAGGECLRADLLVVADGARSRLRDSLGIAHRERPYGQNALIANIGHRGDHGGRAFERFIGSGPLAMLPLLPSGAGQHRSALVWTLPP